MMITMLAVVVVAIKMMMVMMMLMMMLLLTNNDDNDDSDMSQFTLCQSIVMMMIMMMMVMITIWVKLPCVNKCFSVDSSFSLKEFVKLLLNVAWYWIPDQNNYDDDYDGDDGPKRVPACWVV